MALSTSADPSIPFAEFPKIPRLSREVIVTEKIDGTNAQVHIQHDPHSNGVGERTDDGYGICVYNERAQCFYSIRAGSRTQWITPEHDNHGFAKWVFAHAQELSELGEGQHFGEWWGSGIQRGYGLTKGEKRFSLFNVGRWAPGGKDESSKPPCCHVVPILWRGKLDEFMGDSVDVVTSVAGDPVYASPMSILLDDLRRNGSHAVPGFMRPEGIVVFHTAGRCMFKKTLEHDDVPKALLQEN
jgi:hypothetical protein